MQFNRTEEIIQDIKDGKIVILMDDEDRENEGDLVIASSHINAEAINFMITHARGLVCLTITEERAKQLDLSLMSHNNGAKFSTNFTVSIEAAEGVSTGISAKDRALTIQKAIAPYAKPTDIVSPGHVFPIIAKKGGVLHRAGHTEAGCDLARLAGLEPSAVICEIIKENGEMARRDDLFAFAKEHNLKIGTIADLIHYRMENEQTVSESAHFEVHTEFGTFMLHRFSEFGASDTHFALVKGDPKAGTTCVRVHTFEPLRDLFGIYASSSSWSIQKSLQKPRVRTTQALVWIGRGDNIGLSGALDALATHKNTPKTTQKHYSTIGIGSQILRHLGVKDMRLLSGATKFNALSGFDLNVSEFVSA